ncbi:MAG: hypothetical protein PUC65_02945 [Clostridiales bacterium]|nr:hypothetical protein [Clostridiales bacterium]
MDITTTSAKNEKPSIFETMKDSMKEEQKSINRRSETKNHSSLMRTIYNSSKLK